MVLLKKTILWDFDGVILDSMKIKGDGFVELFKDFDSKFIEVFEKFHYENGGVSRFDKIKYFYEEIILHKVSKDEILRLSDKFSSIMQTKLFDKSKLIKDSLLFISNNYQKYNFHIVSGAEHNELNDLCKYFNIDDFFKSIDGSPTKKTILIKKIIKKFRYNINDVILIGDAITDYNAARDNNIEFFGYNNSELKKISKYVDSFNNFVI